MESGWPPPGPPCARGLAWAGLHGAGCSVSSQGQQPCGVRGQPCPLLSPGPFRGPISTYSHGGVKASAPEVQGARTSSPDRASRGGVTWGLVFSSRGRSMPCFSGPARDLPEVGVSWDIRSHRFGSAGVGPPPRTKARPPAGQHPHGMGPCVGFRRLSLSTELGRRGAVWDSPSGPGARRTRVPGRGHPAPGCPRAPERSGRPDRGPALHVRLGARGGSPRVSEWPAQSPSGLSSDRSARRAPLCPLHVPAPLGWLPWVCSPGYLRSVPRGGRPGVSDRGITCPARHCTSGEPCPGSAFYAEGRVTADFSGWRKRGSRRLKRGRRQG